MSSAVLIFSAASAFGQCGSLGSPSTTANAGTRDFNTGSDWSSGFPTKSNNACIINGSTVNLAPGATGNVLSLELNGGNTLNLQNNSQLDVWGAQIINGGAINLNATSDTTVMLLENSATLSGAGTLNLTSSSFVQQASGGLTLTNESTIQGAGTIGNNGLALVNSGTVNASSPAALNLNGGGPITNTGGLLEATGAGTLNIANSVNNGNITASGGTVNIEGNGTANPITGATLTSQSGGTLQTFSQGYAYLSGVTLSAGSTYTNGNNAYLYLAGTINNQGTLNITAGSFSSILWLSGNTTLSGTGTLNLSTSGSGTAAIYQTVGGLTLTNQQTIQGAGTIGSNGVSLVNQGTVNANLSGQTLVLEGVGGVTNAGGLLEATNGGTLQINGATINNSGGNIATSAGGTVEGIGSGIIQGGTLSGNFVTNNGSNFSLDGSTHGAVTLASGSTYNANNDAFLYIQGGIVNNGAININAGADNTILWLNGNTTLSGTGTLNLSTSGSGTAVIEPAVGGLTLTNQQTIQGAGTIGNNGLTIINGPSGTINANAAGQTLFINGSGGLTNNGTLQVDSGSAMHVMDSGTFTNFSGGTLTGGSYSIFSGTLQIDQFGSSGSEITTNAATIQLNGSSAQITDKAGFDALLNFSNNIAAGIFTIQNSQDFLTLSSFANEGVLAIGPGSTFFVGSNAGVFTQTAGSTQVDGTLQLLAAYDYGGLLSGDGTVTGSLTVDTGGTIAPGDSGATGTLTVDGIYSQGANGTLDIGIGGTAPGSEYSVLNILVGAILGGTLEITSVDGFTPVAGDSFIVVDYTGNKGSEFSNVTWANLANDLSYAVVYNPTNVEVEVSSNSPVAPEPGTWWLLAGGLAPFAATRFRRRRRSNKEESFLVPRARENGKQVWDAL